MYIKIPDFPSNQNESQTLLAVIEINPAPGLFYCIVSISTVVFIEKLVCVRVCTVLGVVDTATESTGH